MHNLYQSYLIVISLYNTISKTLIKQFICHNIYLLPSIIFEHYIIYIGSFSLVDGT